MMGVVSFAHYSVMLVPVVVLLLLLDPEEKRKSENGVTIIIIKPYCNFRHKSMWVGWMDENFELKYFLVNSSTITEADRYHHCCRPYFLHFFSKTDKM